MARRRLIFGTTSAAILVLAATAAQSRPAAPRSPTASPTAFVSFPLKNYSPNEDSAAYVSRLMTVCAKAGAPNACYKQAAADLFTDFGLRDSLALLTQNQEQPNVYARCHEVTHYLGRQEFTRLSSAAEAYAACDSTCHGGCYHGVLEAHLKSVAGRADSSALNEHFTSLCGAIDDYNRPLLFYECLHGLGHAAMFVTEDDLHASLAMCDLLASKESSDRCYSGVFMENSSSSTNIDHPSQFLKADDPYYPCNNLADRYQQLCYRYQSSYFALLVKHDWDQVSRLCNGVPAQYQTDCFRTVGTNQVGFTRDMRVWAATCDLVPAAHRTICTQGVITSLTYRFPENMLKPEEFCRLAKADLQQACFNQLGTSIKDWTTDTGAQSAWCDQLSSPAYQQWCRQGIESYQMLK